MSNEKQLTPFGEFLEKDTFKLPGGKKRRAIPNFLKKLLLNPFTPTFKEGVENGIAERIKNIKEKINDK